MISWGLTLGVALFLFTLWLMAWWMLDALDRLDATWGREPSGAEALLMVAGWIVFISVWVGVGNNYFTGG